MDAADEAVPGEEFLVGLRAIGRVGPDGARRVGLVEQTLAQARALVGPHASVASQQGRSAASAAIHLPLRKASESEKPEEARFL